jgi:hypothetical protein
VEIEPKIVAKENENSDKNSGEIVAKIVAKIMVKIVAKIEVRIEPICFSFLCYNYFQGFCFI